MRKRIFWIIVGAVLAAAGLVMYLTLYAPLAKRLKAGGLECQTVEGEVKEARNLIALFKAREIHKALIPEKEVPFTMEELTRQGNFIGVNFISVTPRSIEEKDTYRILPLVMELNSGYETLGKFLGLLDELEGNLLKVREFSVTPKAEDARYLKARLTVNLYLAE